MLDRLFPQSFYVVGTEGNYLTTMNNLDLFHRVLEMIDADTNLDAPEFREEVAAMLEDSDPLSQEEYDEAAESEGGDLDEDYEDEDEGDLTAESRPAARAAEKIAATGPAGFPLAQESPGCDQGGPATIPSAHSAISRMRGAASRFAAAKLTHLNSSARAARAPC